MRTLLLSSSLLACALALAACATTFLLPGIGAMKRVQGYPGPPRAERDVATVFATDARPRYDATFICRIDGQPLERNACANVVYLTPGQHVLGWEYRGGRATGHGELPVVVEAGRVYQLNASPLMANSGITQLFPTAPGTRLTYRNVSPGTVPAGVKADDPVPYGPTSP